MVNAKQFRRGISIEPTEYSHLQGKLDVEAFLDDLGIDIGFRLNDTQLMCHCPDLAGRHKNGDANPSFGFNEAKLAYNCFVCGGGNILELVKMMNPGMDDKAALDFAERHADMDISQDDLIEKIKRILNPPDETEVMPEYPLDNLFQYRRIHPYLYDRGLSKEIIVEMQVGFDSDHCGIIIPHVFQGKLRGWQTRHLVEHPKGVFHCEVASCNVKNRVGKYKNTTHFPKKNTLYGYDRFKQKLRENPTDHVIVVESPMTVLYLMTLGFDNVVGTFGQYSQEQGMLLLAMPRVLFWPDNDEAGFENAQRCVKTLGRYTTVEIVPAVSGKKADAADLKDRAEVEAYLMVAYNAAAFPVVSRDKLATLEDLLVGQNEH